MLFVTVTVFVVSSRVTAVPIFQKIVRIGTNLVLSAITTSRKNLNSLLSNITVIGIFKKKDGNVSFPPEPLAFWVGKGSFLAV